MYYARLRSSWEELSHYDSFIEWPASAPSEKVYIPPTTAEIYAKIVEKTRVFQFLAGLNPDFEYARVHLLDRTPFPTLEEAHVYCLFDQSRRSPMPPISGISSETSAMAIRYAYPAPPSVPSQTSHTSSPSLSQLPAVYTRRHPGRQPPIPDCQASSIAPGLPPAIDSLLSSIEPSPTASIPVTTDDDLPVSHSDDDRPIEQIIVDTEWITMKQQACFRVSKRIEGWKAKSLSQAGRITLIKVVNSTIPSFHMSVFPFPIKMCKKLDSINSRFLWGTNSVGANKTHFISWKNICRPKDKGGLGIRTSLAHNQALLAKLFWRVIKEADKIWAHNLIKRYSPKVSPMLSTPKATDSWIWKGILNAMNNIWSELIWHIGDGESVDYWLEPWILGIPFGRPQGPAPAHRMEIKVSTLICPTQHNWKVSLIQSLFHPDVVKHILSIPLRKFSAKDTLRWRNAQKGIFTVQSAYLSSNQKDFKHKPDNGQGVGNTINWSAVWKMEVPFRIQFFIWKAIQNGIPTNHNLWHRDADSVTLCPRCGEEDETTTHALFFCFDSSRTADSEEAEAVAVIRGMEAALGRGMERVMVLTDCRCLVSAFETGSTDLSWGSLTLAPEMLFLADRIHEFHFRFINRCFNFEAHALAALGACSPVFSLFEPSEALDLVNSAIFVLLSRV
ncbi:hypothetical protein GIB67_001103 [Kingdonia uniflora]|uniref:Reverse transcriptase zinc-binding domain-containing protein n=1 Tax=Kingdonia uniflora TaxID=39325 RepID=A0A7J7MGF8_9MAGN|nr:hypothetical protein GIB67_001103 [Kingdonia uniflora]